MRKRIFLVLILAALCLTGCTMRTVDQMYCLPKRSEEYTNLRSTIEEAMQGLEYCAPLSGENQQTVQMADLDGDAEQEYLLFAKSSSERPLRILIFDLVDSAYSLVNTIECNGFGFDMVEYVQMDNRPGVEMVVGCQLSDKVMRSVSVYTFLNHQSETLVSTNYTKFITVDVDSDSLTELLVLRPGQTETDKGVAELFGIERGTMQRSNEVNMSGPADKLKRILVGQMHDGEPAVYVASAVEDTALITDVFAYLNGVLCNVSFSNESGTSVKTLRNYYVYADDIDIDGVVELPDLITMTPLRTADSTDRQHLIRWYAMQADGSEVDKCFTYHNFVGGWYLDVPQEWGPRLTVEQDGNSYAFYIWDDNYKTSEKIATIFSLTGQNREEQALVENRFVLLKTDFTIYAASLNSGAQAYGIDKDDVIKAFHLIQQDWKTGEI